MRGNARYQCFPKILITNNVGVKYAQNGKIML